MERGSIDVDGLDGGFDLRATLESGQSYLWRRTDGRMYRRDGGGDGGGNGDEPTPVEVRSRDGDPAGDRPRYYTVLPARVTETNEPEVLRVRQAGRRLFWEASTPRGSAHLRRLLRLDDDLPAIVDATADDPLVRRSYEAYRGMRLVRDPPFPTLVSFICSAQMHVSRIHEMQTALARTFGETVTVEGEDYHAFPTPERLAGASEADLRDLRLGYRAPYVKRTAEMVAENESENPERARDLPYEAAREYLTRFVGVGEKVADCVCLFALDHLQAVPLDTWIRRSIAEYYPECDRGSYAETSRAIREQFGGDYAGYAQTYVFHYLRNGGD